MLVICNQLFFNVNRFRYLATGDSLKTISFSYRLGHSTVYQIVKDTCKVITENLLQETMPVPTEEMWKAVAIGFNEMWNFPNCVGALDGKHITIQAPSNSGSLYFNYKKNFSIVLLALVDANCNFLVVDVGAYGKSSDGGIFANSNLGQKLEKGAMNLPKDAPLPNSNITAPFVIVGDEAFPLKAYLMRPYPRNDNLSDIKRNFNYRLCRARRTVENAFGILTQKFRIYNRRIQASPENADYIILSTCILHNFIRKYEGYGLRMAEASRDSRNNEDRDGLSRLPLQGGNATKNAFDVRDLFKDYFNSEYGSVSWEM